MTMAKACDSLRCRRRWIVREIMDAPAPGGLGGTYAGNPLAIAASHAVIAAIEEEGLIARSNMLGDKLRARLANAAKKFPQIADIRGPGSMIAAHSVLMIEISSEPDAVLS